MSVMERHPPPECASSSARTIRRPNAAPLTTPHTLRYLGRGQRGRPTSTRSQRAVPETLRGVAGSAMVAQFQLKVFGSPQLARGGRSPVRFRTKKHLAVLLYLHFEGRARPVPRG